MYKSPFYMVQIQACTVCCVSFQYFNFIIIFDLFLLIYYIPYTLLFQHFLTMFFATVVIPLIVSNALCMSDNPAVTLELFGVTFFTSGVCSIIQVLLGVR